MHAEPLYLQPALSSTIAGQLLNLYVVRIYFSIDNPKLLLTTYYILSGLLLTLTTKEMGSKAQWL